MMDRSGLAQPWLQRIDWQLNTQYLIFMCVFWQDPCGESITDKR